MPRPPKPLINDDTLAILRFLHRVRYADRDHIMAYCSRPAVRGRAIGFAREAVRSALGKLVANQYLCASKWYPKRRNTAGAWGRDKLVYLLGQKGFAAIGEPPTLQHQRRIAKKAPYPSMLRHEMMIPNFHTWLLLAERAGHFAVREIRGRDRNGGIAEDYTDRRGEQHRMRIDPDFAFILTRHGREFPVFLEAETGEKSVEHTLQHVLKYGRAWEHRLFEPKYGIRDFVVVFLIKTDAKLQNRLEEAKRVSWFTKRALFLPEEMLDLAKPDQPMERIFARPAGDHVSLVPSKVRGAGATVEEPEPSTSSSFHGSAHARPE